MVGTAQAQDNNETSTVEVDSPATVTARDHNSTRSNAVTIAGPDGGHSEKEKCEAEGGVWHVRPGAAEGFCFKKLSTQPTTAAPGNDFNSSRSNKTGSISGPTGETGDNGNGHEKEQATKGKDE